MSKIKKKSFFNSETENTTQVLEIFSTEIFRFLNVN